MNYFIKESKINNETAKTAWSKAREDAELICEDAGYSPVFVKMVCENRVDASAADKLRMHFKMARAWRDGVSKLVSGDKLLIQLPVINNSIFLPQILKKLKNKGVKIIGLIHDLEMLRLSISDEYRFSSRLRMKIEESGTIGVCDRLIVHNESMLEYMVGLGVERNKMVPLGIFDYIMTAETEKAVTEREITLGERLMIVAGNLSPEKAGYVYTLPREIPLQLYGVFYKDEGNENLNYHGAFAPEKLPEVLEGAFGLVWDGATWETCDGVYGKYLCYNNPHKTSLYLASGIPVVIWSHAALAKFIETKKVGITAASISEAWGKIIKMSDEEYAELVNNACEVGKLLRDGAFLKNAIRRSE